MTDFTAARQNMVNSQIRTAGVITPGIINAFETIPREKFVLAGKQDVAYTDEDLPVGEGRFLLEPFVHAKMVEAAAPRPGDIVLDIGGGTGYSAAILSPLVTTVVALEESSEFLDEAAQLWTGLDVNNVVGVQGRLVEGDPKNAPFNVIFINGAIADIPENIVEQLTPDGRLVAVIRKPGHTLGRATLIQNLGNGGYSSYELFDAGSPYLPGFAPKPGFVF